MLTRKLFLRQMGGGCLTLVLAGCGGGGDDDDTVTPDKVTHLAKEEFAREHTGLLLRTGATIGLAG